MEDRKPRADSARNRERLIAAAKAGFAETGPDVSLEEIARRAGVGIGTLYRHFPGRDAIVAAVYQREVDQLGEAADRLLATQRPGAALRAWLRLLVDYIATKRMIAPALSAIPGGPDALYSASTSRMREAMTKLARAAVAAGDIRPDVEAEDLFRALVGISYGYADPGWDASAHRLIDVFMDGLGAKAAADPA